MTLWIILCFAGFAIIAGLWLHHVFEGEWLPHDLYREWKLSRRDLTGLDARWVASADRSDIVITLTTTPSRIGLLDHALKSLLDQSRLPARIVLNLPEFSEREQVAYQIPKHLGELKSLDIQRCQDLGPGTKLIPALSREKPDTALLVLDDDRIYPGWRVARYEDATRQMPMPRSLWRAGSYPKT